MTEINGIRVLIEEIISIVDNSTEKLSVKSEQIRTTREQMKELIDKTLPVLSTTKTMLTEIKVEDLTELK